MDREMHDLLMRFERLHGAVIDASSMIYMRKAEFLEVLSRAIQLISPAEIIRETGYKEPAVRSVEMAQVDSTHDERLIRCALKRRLPLISEDRRVLMRMKREQHPYYNALMMLHYLLFRGRLDTDEHARCLERLLEIARYGRRVLDTGAALHAVILGR